MAIMGIHGNCQEPQSNVVGSKTVESSVIVGLHSVLFQALFDLVQLWKVLCLKTSKNNRAQNLEAMPRGHHRRLHRLQEWKKGAELSLCWVERLTDLQATHWPTTTTTYWPFWAFPFWELCDSDDSDGVDWSCQTRFQSAFWSDRVSQRIDGHESVLSRLKDLAFRWTQHASTSWWAWAFFPIAHHTSLTHAIMRLNFPTSFSLRWILFWQVAVSARGGKTGTRSWHVQRRAIGPSGP